MARAGCKEETLPLFDGERVRAVVELVFDSPREHVAAVAVNAPFLAPGVRLVFDDRPARAEHSGRPGSDVRLVVRPVDRTEVKRAARGHKGILPEFARRRSTSPTS